MNLNLTPSQIKLLKQIASTHPMRRKRLSLGRLAMLVEVNRRTAKRGVKRLSSEGLIVVSRERMGQPYSYELAPEARQFIGETA